MGRSAWAELTFDQDQMLDPEVCQARLWQGRLEALRTPPRSPERNVRN